VGKTTYCFSISLHSPSKYVYVFEMVRNTYTSSPTVTRTSKWVSPAQEMVRTIFLESLFFGSSRAAISATSKLDRSRLPACRIFPAPPLPGCHHKDLLYPCHLSRRQGQVPQLIACATGRSNNCGCTWLLLSALSPLTTRHRCLDPPLEAMWYVQLSFFSLFYVCFKKM
jgi:hypothetical protein